MPHHSTSKSALTQEELHQLLDYDPGTGVFRWKISKANVKAGQIAGSVAGIYWAIKINTRVYHAHRLAWLYVYGEFPDGRLYHKNGNTLDNRPSNLREGADRSELTLEKLKSLLTYEPDTGLFRWKVSGARKAKAGEIAGAVIASGYVQIIIGRKGYMAHRLAWLYMHGRWPDKGLDHINGLRSDNRICNLREASQAENLQNIRRPRTNTTGYLGVTRYSRANKYVAKICVNRKSINLGIFSTPEEAHQAYLSAKAKLHTFQPTPRS